MLSKLKSALFATLCASLGGLSSCGFGDDVKPIVTIGDMSLYPDEITLGIGSDFTSEDSAKLVDTYIKNWCIEQIMYEKAQESVTDLDEIELLIEKYRKSLMVYEYQLQLIGQNLSRPINNAELTKFYNENIELYTAHETLFQGLFITIPKNSASLLEIHQHVRQPEITMGEIDRIINKYGLKVKYYDDQWTPIAAVKQQGLFHLSKSHDFGKMHYVEETDEENTYMLIVQDYIVAGSPQPFDYVKNRIQNMLSEQRKADYIRELSEKIYNEALASGHIKYNKNYKNK